MLPQPSSAGVLSASHPARGRDGPGEQRSRLAGPSRGLQEGILRKEGDSLSYMTSTTRKEKAKDGLSRQKWTLVEICRAEKKS